MTSEEKKQFKAEFKQQFSEFVECLKRSISCDDGQWTVKGFIDIYKNVFTISSDTKIVSKILEIHLFPQILKFAEDNRYKLVLAERQNYYPDITFIKIDNEEVMFAVDIKTTYRRIDGRIGFTLGSHGAYFIDRNSKKNIQYPYKQYTGHYCLGVIYSKSTDQQEVMDDLLETKIFSIENLKKEGDVSDIITRERNVRPNLQAITSVIKDFDFFFSEKWKIASDSQGSGNTANIGSVNTEEDLKNETGVFANLGEEWFDDYWINYNKVHIVKNGISTPITNIWDFLDYKNRKDLESKVGNGAKKKK